MYFYIYKITNTINNKIYIGVHKTIDLNDGYMGSGKLLNKAFEKYGKDNFDKDILEYFTDYESALSREREIVDDEFLLREDTYNIRRGGSGGFDYINKNKLNDYDKTGENNPFYNKTHSDDVKKKLSVLATKQWAGIPKSDEHKKKISESHLGEIFTDERKKRISEATKGRVPWNKGKSAPKWKCPNCGKDGGGDSNKKRHFTKCGVII